MQPASNRAHSSLSVAGRIRTVSGRAQGHAQGGRRGAGVTARAAQPDAAGRAAPWLRAVRQRRAGPAGGGHAAQSPAVRGH